MSIDNHFHKTSMKLKGQKVLVIQTTRPFMPTFRQYLWGSICATNTCLTLHLSIVAWQNHISDVPEMEILTFLYAKRCSARLKRTSSAQHLNLFLSMFGICD